MFILNENTTGYEDFVHSGRLDIDSDDVVTNADPAIHYTPSQKSTGFESVAK